MLALFSSPAKTPNLSSLNCAKSQVESSKSMATLEEVKKSFEEILKALEPSTCYLVREQRPKFESLISALNTFIAAAPVPAPVTPAPESQELAQTTEPASVLLIRDGIVAAAKAARAENRSASWITWASGWKDFQAKFTAIAKGFKLDDSETVAQVAEMLYEALRSVKDDDTFIVFGSMEVAKTILYEISWRTKQPDGLDWSLPFREGFVQAYWEMLEKGKTDEEMRYYMINYFAAANESTAHHLVSVYEREKSTRVRTGALQGIITYLAQTEKAVPELRAKVKSWVETEKDDSVKGNLLKLAGKLKMPELENWAAGQIESGPLSWGAREGLALLQSEGAWNLLFSWIDGKKDSEETMKKDNYSFRDEVTHLHGFADLDFAKEQYYRLIDYLIGQDQRNGYATGIFARQLAWLKDKPLAFAIAEKHQKRYKELWNGTEDKDKLYVLDELQLTIDSLTNKGGIMLDRPIQCAQQ